MDAIGIKDVLGLKSLGSANQANVVKVTLNAWLSFVQQHMLLDLEANF